jgi:hypothetical protein
MKREKNHDGYVTKGRGYLKKEFEKHHHSYQHEFHTICTHSDICKVDTIVHTYNNTHKSYGSAAIHLYTYVVTVVVVIVWQLDLLCLTSLPTNFSYIMEVSH